MFDCRQRKRQQEEIFDQLRRGVDSPVVLNDDIIVFPGFCDVHVHLREPGFFYKESIKSGTTAAAAGGYTQVCCMPNVSPVPDSLQNLQVMLDIIKRDALINVSPYGAITRGEQGLELSDMRQLAPYVCAFSDDGKGVQSEEVMTAAMEKARSLDKVIAAHCEDNALLCGGYIHDGEYARSHGHKGISSESEYAQIERDLKLCRATGAKYHVCHISAKESVSLIRQAKREGVDVTCETAPHYLLLSDRDIKEDGRFKMNPPLRSKSDRDALIEGLLDGTIDMIATDHAPHSAEEKSRGLKDSAFGVTGLECAFPVLYTFLVRTGVITAEKLCDLMCFNPLRRFGLPRSTGDFTAFYVGEPYTINAEKFYSKGKSTPFDGVTVYGKCLFTALGGKIVWQENSTESL